MFTNSKRIHILAYFLLAVCVLILVYIFIMISHRDTLRLSGGTETVQLDFDAHGYEYKVNVTEKYAYFCSYGELWSDGERIAQTGEILGECKSLFSRSDNFYVGISNQPDNALYLPGYTYPIENPENPSELAQIDTILGYERQKIVMNEPIPLAYIYFGNNEPLTKQDVEELLNGNIQDVSLRYGPIIVVNIAFSDVTAGFLAG